VRREEARSPQHRVDRIRAFREELAETERELGPVIDPARRAELEQYHATTIDGLHRAFEVDASDTERQLSLGMRVVSLLGAFALCAAVFLFFYRYWGRMTVPLQIGLLVTGPVLGLGLTEFAARRERTHYFAWLAGLVTCASLVLALEALGRIYGLPASPWRYLGWGGFGWLLAFGYRFRLVLAAAVVSLTVFLLGIIVQLSGAHWVGFLARPEGYALAGLGWLAAAEQPRLIPPDLASPVRLTGAVITFAALLALGADGNLSFLPLAREPSELLYDLVAIALAAAGVWLGIRRGWADLRLASTGFLVVLLIVKAFDWWWEWMPREFFFLILGLLALAILVVLRRARKRLL
jgi:uncharacterized membrane protein